MATSYYHLIFEDEAQLRPKHQLLVSLVEKHSGFYESLASGERRPTTSAQEHFVAVVDGTSQPESDHEWAYLFNKGLVLLEVKQVRHEIDCKPQPVPARKTKQAEYEPDREPRREPTCSSGHSRYCEYCGTTIPDARIAALPDTRLCIDCASNDPSGRPNRRVSEPWGSRDDWKRDSGANWSNSQKNKL